MKRTQMYKKVNRKSSSIFNHVNRNVVYPTIVFNPHLCDDEVNSAVQIVELNSDEEVQDNDQQNKFEYKNTWCNVTSSSQNEISNYRINSQARDNRRRNKDTIQSVKENDSEDILNQIFTDFYGIDCHNRTDDLNRNNYQSEYFTLIDNNFDYSDTSESNEYENIEMIPNNSAEPNDKFWNVNDNTYTEDLNTHGDYNAEKRTIWIYALKNKRYLSEHDYELVNITSKDSSSNTDEEEPTKEVPNICRIATPIPNYIPKLNLPLSPTLPTVEEVAEPNKQSSSNIVDLSANKTETVHFQQKPINSWLADETHRKSNNNFNSTIKETSIDGNWQRLSPRDKRRIKLSQIKEQCSPNVKSEVTEQVYCEPKVIIRTKTQHSASQEELVEKEIHLNERNETKQFTTNDTNAEVSANDINDNALSESLDKLQKPRIKVRTETITETRKVSDPIEKFEGNWIGTDEPEIIEVYDYDINNTIEDNEVSNKEVSPVEECAGNKLFIRNMSLIKPAEWTQYVPVTGSMPSLNLSLSINTDVSKNGKSWIKRFFKFLHCCK